ncbi:MAG: hypothetical protein J4F48_12840 [Nitrospinae bacterium]|nr:hypothetical protein [Nitrospinota bacterium]
MNKSIIRTCLTIVFLFVLAGNAGAQSIDEARAAYAEGRFMEAASLARTLGTSEGHALAADSLAIHGYYMAPEGEKEGLFRRAEESARKAVRLDAANPEAHLQLAHAMGRQAQVKEGYATRVRDAIEEALRLDPKMAAAHVSLGAWHAGAVGAGGFFAGLLYGADEEKALAHFERALALAPRDKVALYEYALGLLSLDAEGNRAKVRGLLERAIGLPPKDAFERLVHQKAVERLAALVGG